MKIETLVSLALPTRFTEFMMGQHRKQQLHLWKLPEFIGAWQRYVSANESDDGAPFAYFVDYATMQGLSAEIGGAIGSRSHDEPEQLVKLVSPSEGPDLFNIWEQMRAHAGRVIDFYMRKYSEPPHSLHSMLRHLIHAGERSRFPELAAVKSEAELNSTPIDLDDNLDTWVDGAVNSFNIGLAIAAHYPDFYYSMGEFYTSTDGNGGQSTRSTKRAYYMAIVKIWADLCRPDQAHLLGNPLGPVRA